ncbi:MAG: hypothetical protein KY448_09790 [Cyanobacteria bacterium 0813]|nr:hypothetical protein [Cyanobacteria bacterium 0813]
MYKIFVQRILLLYDYSVNKFKCWFWQQQAGIERSIEIQHGKKIISKLLLLAGSRSPEVWYGDRAIAQLQ